MMTSISSSASFAPQSATTRMQNFLQSEVSSGTVNSADATALSSAISDISNAFQTSGSGSTSTASATTSASTTPTSMKDKIDNAIDQEVSDGKLTTDQATELKKVFSDASQQKVGKGGHGGHHHHVASSDTDPTTTDPTTDSSTTSASSTDLSSALSGFLKTLQSAISGNSAYNSAGAQNSTLQSMLVNAVA